MRILIILILFSLVGCESPAEKKERQIKEYPELSLDSTISLGGGMYRVENTEVICYQYFSKGLQCKFKK